MACWWFGGCWCWRVLKRLCWLLQCCLLVVELLLLCVFVQTDKQGSIAAPLSRIITLSQLSQAGSQANGEKRVIDKNIFCYYNCSTAHFAEQRRHFIFLGIPIGCVKKVATTVPIERPQEKYLHSNYVYKQHEYYCIPCLHVKLIWAHDMPHGY